MTRTPYSVVDNEFDSMKDRFENEMRRVEDEMQRLRREFEGYRPTTGGRPGGAAPNYSSSSAAYG